MSKKHGKPLNKRLLQIVQCLAACRGAFSELARRAGRSRSEVTKWTQGIRTSERFDDLGEAMCTEIRETGGFRITLPKNSVRDALKKLRGKKNGK